MSALPLPVESPAIIEHLDEDWAVPCDFGAKVKRDGLPVCDNPADWIAWTSRCCPDRTLFVLLCDAHCVDVMARPGFCNYCHFPFLPGSVGFRLIEPLNRRTT